MKFSEASEDFDNIVLQNQQLIMAATEAAKSAAHTVNQLSEILKAVLPAIVRQAGRVDPDPTPVGRPPPAPPPSTSPSQRGEQREPRRSDQMPEKLSKIMERSANNFCKQNSLEMVFSRQTETAILNLCPIPWQNQSVHPSCCSISRHVDLELKKRYLTEVFIQSSRTASRDRSFCNKIHLVNFGLEILSKSGLEAVATDKDGGYSLVDPNVLTNVHLQMLMNGQFFETDFMNWDKRCAKASSSYSILCQRVEDLEQDPQLARELKNSMSTPGASIEVQLVTSCKSHKPPKCSTSCFCRSRNVFCKSTQNS